MDKKNSWLAVSLSLMLSGGAQSSTFQLGIDNDVVFQSDGDYTSGLYIGYGTDQETIDPMPFIELDGSTGHGFVQLGQKIWTPSDISAKEPQLNERPYAGLLYLKLAAGRFNGERAYLVSIMTGYVGPASGAEAIQKKSHRLFNSTYPEGWDYQVKNKLVTDLTLEFDQLFARSNRYEFSGYGRIVAGNFQPEVAAGIGWRWGSGLGNHFNSSYLRPHRQSVASGYQSGAMYLYSAIEARYRFSDITISGDTLKPVPEVTLKKAQASIVVGAAGYFRSMGVSFSVESYSRSYRESESQWHLIGLLALNWPFD